MDTFMHTPQSSNRSSFCCSLINYRQRVRWSDNCRSMGACHGDGNSGEEMRFTWQIGHSTPKCYIHYFIPEYHFRNLWCHPSLYYFERALRWVQYYSHKCFLPFLPFLVTANSSQFLHRASQVYWTGQNNLYNYSGFCHFPLHDNLGALRNTVLEQMVTSPNKHHAINTTVSEVPCFPNLSTVDGSELPPSCFSNFTPQERWLLGLRTGLHNPVTKESPVGVSGWTLVIQSILKSLY
jgi:hypothetical protein